jgi:hypothetical protein
LIIYSIDGLRRGGICQEERGGEGREVTLLSN